MTSEGPGRTVVVVDGVRLAVDLAGPAGAPAVVLLHALGEQGSTWEQFVQALTTGGRFRTVVVDLRGHGDSDRPGRYSFEAMAADVLGVLDALALRRVHLIGHSMGGVVAYLLAAGHPDRVDHLVIEDIAPPTPRPPVDLQRPPGDLPFDWHVVPAIRGQIDTAGPHWWDLLDTITAPTLVVAGGPTSHVPQHHLVDVVRRLPDARLVTIAAGHDVHEHEPAAFAAAVLEWLDPQQSRAVAEVAPPRGDVHVHVRGAHHLPGCVTALRAVHETDGYPTWWPPDPAAWLSPPGWAASWVAVDDDEEVLGHVCVVRGVDDPVLTAATGAPAERMSSISRLFTAPAVRGRGLAVGTRLLAAAREWSDQQDLQLVLDVVDDGAPAVRLYERLGWQLVDVRDADWTTPQGDRHRVRVYRAPETT